MRETARRPVGVALWCGVLALAMLGITSTAFRGALLVEALRSRGEAGFFETLERAGAAPIGVSVEDLAAYDEPFENHPRLTVLHLLPAGLFMVLAPLQFSSRFRNRHLRFHRWSGRLLLVLGVLLGLAGFFFGLSTPFGGTVEAWGVVVFGGLFLASLATAYVRIRSGDVAGHRRWMIRAFSVALGISTMRVVLGILLLTTNEPVRTLFGIAIWIGFLLSCGAAELWIRRTPDAQDARLTRVA